MSRRMLCNIPSFPLYRVPPLARCWLWRAMCMQAEVSALSFMWVRPTHMFTLGQRCIIVIRPQWWSTTARHHTARPMCGRGQVMYGYPATGHPYAPELLSAAHMADLVRRALIDTGHLKVLKVVMTPTAIQVTTTVSTTAVEAPNPPCVCAMLFFWRWPWASRVGYLRAQV